MCIASGGISEAVGYSVVLSDLPGSHSRRHFF